MKYSKPSLEIEAFDVLDVITASAGTVIKPQDPSFEGGDIIDGLSVGDFDFQGEFVF